MCIHIAQLLAQHWIKVRELDAMFPLKGLSTKITVMRALQRYNTYFMWKKPDNCQYGSNFPTTRKGWLWWWCVGFGFFSFFPLVHPSAHIIVPIIFYSHSFIWLSPPTLCPHFTGSLGSISNCLSTFLSSLYIHSNLYQNIHWASATLVLSPQEVCSEDILSHYPLPRLPMLPL